MRHDLALGPRIAILGISFRSVLRVADQPCWSRGTVTDVRLRFNAPPNWPPPPPGWSPPPGWKPDPSWPPAPDGWRWWVPDVPTAGATTNVVARSATEIASPSAPSPPKTKREGWWGRRKRAKAVAVHDHQLESWSARLYQLNMWLALAKGDARPGADLGGMVTKAGEGGIVVMPNTSLVEMRRAQGHYVGGYSGVSVPIGGGIRFRTGGGRGHFVPGPEGLTEVDEGHAIITTHRTLFTGARFTREWQIAKMISVDYLKGTQRGEVYAMLGVSNRQKVSGLAVDADQVEMLQFALAYATARANGSLPNLAQEIEHEIAEHTASKP